MSFPLSASSLRPGAASLTNPARTIALLALGLSLSAPGCGRATPSAPAPSEHAGTPASGTFKVALITSGPTNDNGWNAGAYQGLQDIKEQLGATVANVEAKSPGEQEENLRAFARDHYNIVIGHGAEYEAPALKMESDFPNTLFVVSSGSKIGKNTTPIVLKLEDGAYLLGMLAAGMTSNNKLGAVGAEKIAPVQSVFAAYAAGAKAYNKYVQVVSPVYTGNWDDVGKAKQATLALLDQGCDIIIQDLDAAAQGVFQAVHERSRLDKLLFALGTNSDQNNVAPDVVLASAPIDISKAFLDIAGRVKAGTFHPNAEPYDMKSGVIGFVINPKLQFRLPPDGLLDTLQKTQKQIESGAIQIPRQG